MAQTIKLKRSATSGAVPTTASLALGEMAINTYDGKAYIKKDNGTESVVEIGSGTSYSAGTGISLSGTTFSLTDTNAKLNLSGGTLTGNLSLGDNDKATFGAGDDLQIYHDGSNSYISDTSGTGDLYLRGSNLRLTDNDGTLFLFGATNADTRLYYSGSSKLATSSTGIDVTGTVTATGGNSTNWNTAYGWGNHASAGYATSSASYRTTSSVDGAVSSAGWVTVATNTSGRKHGEIIVSDSDSGDHAFIRIDWMRSYADSNFSVLQVGGHANRITGVRVLSQDSDNTYGVKSLQVYVTTGSTYGVRVNTVGSPRGFSTHSTVTPVIENTKVGYTVHGNELTGLDAVSLAAEEGIKAGGIVYASGGSSTNWNTAYGWGDHASAGYYPASNPNGYTNDQTAAEILTAIKTVDGSGSGLDADTVDGLHGTDIVETSDTISGNLDTEYDAQMFSWSTTTTGKPAADYGQGISIVSSGKTHNNSNNWITQLGFGTTNTTSYFRTKVNSSGWSDWRTIWNSSNDGSGSGLDADLLDGQHGSYYAPASHVHSYLPLAGGTLTGALKLEGGSYSSGIDTATVALAIDKGDYIHSDDGNYLRRILGHTTGGAIEIGQGVTALIASINLLPGAAGNSAAKVNGNTIWNAGNDGSGSGLDADTVRGSVPSFTDTNTTYSADGNYGMTLSGTTFRLEDDRRRNSTTVDIYSGNTHDYTFYDASVGIRWYTAGAEEMRLTNTGDLHVDGNITAYSTTVSDINLKTNILPITGALGMLDQINGYTFDYIKDNKPSAGIIAQEIQKVLPSAVLEKHLPYHDEDESVKRLTVEYDQIIGLLVAAVKELKAEIEVLKANV